MKTVYGPVSSWRLGSSLGVDLICSNKKICSFDCIYCQLGKEMEKTIQRKNFISIDDMKNEVSEVLQKVKPDVITFSGIGEPTLAKNLDQAVSALKDITKIPLAVITNSSLINNDDVKKTMSNVDIVVAKLDAPNEKLFQEINQPVKNITLKSIIKGMQIFKNNYSGKFSIQTMFMDNNKEYAEEISAIVRKIDPDETQINTPLRPCPIKPLTESQIDSIEEIFIAKGLNTVSVYKSEKPKTSPIDKMDMIKRRRSVL